MSFSVQVAGKTDIGCVRSNNEDNYGYDWRYGIYVVCDGMGGQAAGEVASKLGVDTVLQYFREAASNGKPPAAGPVVEGVSARAGALASAIQLSNRAIKQMAADNPSQSGMGSTITAVLVEKEARLYSIAHVGDSRIYLLRPDEDVIQQLTADHSLVMEQVRRGLITLEEAQHSEMQNIIIRALGSEDTVEPDLDDRVAECGDVLLLCSDGLTRYVPDQQILAQVKAADDLMQACANLIQLAKDAGGADNITCLLLRFVERPWFKNLFGTFPGGGGPKWQDSF
jgi:serine/threonine protein phosphatase PrpC